MKAAAIAIIFIGYTINTYGIILMKRYNITFLEWINPFAPNPWPAGNIPSGQLFPGSPASSSSGSAGSTPQTQGNVPGGRVLGAVAD